jgi:hypothetical protein
MLFEIQNDEYWNGKSSKVNPEIIGEVPLLQVDDSGNAQNHRQYNRHTRARRASLAATRPNCSISFQLIVVFTLSCQL